KCNPRVIHRLRRFQRSTRQTSDKSQVEIRFDPTSAFSKMPPEVIGLWDDGSRLGSKILAIIDCHTHIWQSPDQLGQVDLGEQSRLPKSRAARVAPSGRTIWRSVPAADPEHHWSQTGMVDKSIVLGFKSRYLRAEIPNRFVADYVSRDPQKLIG